jgi:putative dehydrogenase
MMVSATYQPAAARIEMYDKDVQIIGAFAKSVGCPVPLFALSALPFTSALAQDRGKQDTAAIVSVLREMAGLGPDPLPSSGEGAL